MASAYDSRLGREGLRPAASPVDTFVTPKKETSLLSLAEGLATFAPAVGRVAETIHEKSLKLAAERAAEDTAAAVQAGAKPGEVVSRINPAASSAYREAAKKQAAQLAAFNYGSELNKFMTEKLSDETDLDSFNKRVDEFSAEWSKKNIPEGDGEFLRFFQRQAAVLRANNVSQMSWRVGEKKRLKTEEEFGALVGAAVNTEFLMTKPEGLEERINQAVGVLRQRAFDMGIQGSRINELIFDNVSALAIADGNPDLADALFTIPTGSDGKATLGGIPTYKEKIARASHAAEVAALQKEKGKSEKKESMGDIHLQALNDALIYAVENGEDPATMDITFFLKEMNNVDPKRVDDMLQLRNTFALGFKRQTVPAIETQLYTNLYDPDVKWGQKDLLRAFQSGGINNDTYLKFRKLIESRDRVRSARKGATPDTLMAEARRVIGENVDALGLTGDEARIIKGQFRVQLRVQMYEWLDSEEGQKATPAKVKEHARLLADSLMADLSKPKKKP